LTPGPWIEVRPVAPDELTEPLSLLEEFLRDREHVPPPFVEQIARAVERGDLEVLAAWAEPGIRPVGVAVLAFRPSLSLGALFASIEDIYVSTDARWRGTGRALLEAVEGRCKERGVSYVEVQTDVEAAPFYEALGYEPEEGVRVFSRSYAF
jgi:GNAT superfamily N-acetyltransferase